MKRLAKHLAVVVLLALTAAAQLPQHEYQPKFPGDPARSEAEAGALGYIRVVINAQKNYSKKHSGDYATSLAALVGQGSFTRRMTEAKRGEYTVKFRGDGKGYSLWMTPAQPTAALRAFYADEHGTIRAEEDKQASAQSASVNKQ